MNEKLSFERVNEIFCTIRELSELKNKQKEMQFRYARGNGKFPTRLLRYILQFEILCKALERMDECMNCASLNTEVCARCIRGCNTDFYERAEVLCEKCGLRGKLGKSHIRHESDNGELVVLCNPCHLEEHRKG